MSPVINRSVSITRSPYGEKIMTMSEIREALLEGQEVFALTKKEYHNVYQWARNERLDKGKDAGIKSCGGGEYLIWHEDFHGKVLPEGQTA